MDNIVLFLLSHYATDIFWSCLQSCHYDTSGCCKWEAEAYPLQRLQANISSSGWLFTDFDILISWWILFITIFGIKCRILLVETRKQWLLPMSALLSGLFINLVLRFFCRNSTISHRSLMELYYFHFCSCAAETLNTLKFAQRAKLIQNNVSAILWSVWIVSNEDMVRKYKFCIFFM